MQRTLNQIADRAAVSLNEMQTRAQRNPPAPDDLRLIRESLRMSQAEFAETLGFKDGKKKVRNWEHGVENNGVREVPTGSALQCMRLVLAIDAAMRETTVGGMKECLRAALPDCMKDG